MHAFASNRFSLTRHTPQSERKRGLVTMRTVIASCTRRMQENITNNRKNLHGCLYLYTRTSQITRCQAINSRSRIWLVAPGLQALEQLAVRMVTMWTPLSFLIEGCGTRDYELLMAQHFCHHPAHCTLHWQIFTEPMDSLRPGRFFDPWQ